jgi:hypothetical protein
VDEFLDDQKPPVTNKIYNILKTVSMIVLPGISSAIFILWLWIDIPGIVWILGGLAVLTFYYGLYLRFSTIRYYHNKEYDGQVVITKRADGKKLFSLELNKPPMEIESMPCVSFQIAHEFGQGYEEVD